MDSFSTSLLRSLTEVIVALLPDAAVGVYVRDGRAGLVERRRGGAETAQTHLPSTLPDGDETRQDAAGWYVIALPLQGQVPTTDTPALGMVVLTAPDEPPTATIAAIRAIVMQTALALKQNELHQELQHSFNGLFIVYEAGHMLNFSHTADDVLTHVVNVLSRTLHFPHCAVMLLQGDELVPVAQAGLDSAWCVAGTLPFGETFAAQVLRSGAAVQWGEGSALQGRALPRLASGEAPTRLLCAPLSTRSGTLGALEVYWDEPMGPVADDALFVVSVLAVELAAALENARLYEELREREERLTQYTAKLVNSQEEERRRISRDIHDGLGQMIVSAFQYLQAHEYTLPPDHPRDTFKHGLDVLQECIKETRRVMSDLRPSTLDDFGLVVALQQQLDTAAKEAKWDARFKVNGSVPRLAPVVETTVFRVVQEALNNARKYAKSGRVQVTLTGRDDELAVEVRDWGEGFETRGVAARPERGEHLGLMGMRERASLLGGTARITSSPGKGTTVRITLPVRS